MFRFTKENIYNMTTPMKFNKGMEYYKEKRIKSISFNEENLLFDASVLGTRPHSVQVQFSKNGSIRNIYCSCEDYTKSEKCCKHITSVLLMIKDKDDQGFFDSSIQKQAAKDLFNFFQGKTSNVKSKINTEITIEFLKTMQNRRGPAAALSMRIGVDRLYVVKSIEEFLTARKKNNDIVYGKGFTYDPAIYMLGDIEEQVIAYLEEIWENERLVDYLTADIRKQSTLKDKEIFISEVSLKKLLEILKHGSFNAIIGESKVKDIKIVNEDIPVEFTLVQNGNGIELNLDSLLPLTQLTYDGQYLFYNNKIYNVSAQQQENLYPFFEIIKQKKISKIKFMDTDKEKFFAEMLPSVEKIGPLFIDDELQNLIEKRDFEPEIYLDRFDDIITADVKFKYGTRIINPFGAGVNDKLSDDNKIIVRDMDKERVILDNLAETDFKVGSNSKIYLEEEEKIFDFVNYVVPRLQEYCQVYYSESFKALSFKRSPSFSGFLRLNALNDFLEFSFSIEGVERDELAAIFESIRQRKKYYRLKDGTFLPLESNSLIEMSEIVEQLELNTKELESELIALPKYRAMYIDTVLKESGMKFFERNTALKNLIRDIHEPAETEYKIPESMKGILRDYQKLGFKWLKTLSVYGMGGILADDMGLGKTLQVIALLKYEKQTAGSCTSIVIVPTSLIYNWCAEVQKFAPDMTITAIVGTKEERKELILKAKDTDILVTSYALIRRDIEDYLGYDYRYCILDEAQHIKNPTSQAAKAVKQIVSKHRLALTGTPMENNLTELWSVFDFILPGYLRSHGKFVEKFESPISKGDSAALASLSKQIRPFILRRLKQDVLKELPEKIEHVIEAELTEEQKKLYVAYLNQAKGEILQELREKGFEKSHIKILSILTRLRQLCCHPALFVEDYKGESGKLLLLKEIVLDSIEAGHRILLFSQFTSMLGIIRKWLEQEGIQPLYLDGSTPAEERMKLVRRFNNGEGKIFLLSLKSGGTGLNLTGADTVIHYDPWWNPAVEDQATDRAYRIGQTKTVHVMKLVTHGTIEEKIIGLKDRKRQLVDAVIQSGDTLLTKLSHQDLRELFGLEE